MPRNSSKIEKLAINRVTALFLSCDKIQPWLPQGDKEPLWDGFLYLYSSSEWTNRDMKGRVACQVKGRDSNSDSEMDSYSVDVCDLENYLRDGGVLFFVVDKVLKKDLRILRRLNAVQKLLLRILKFLKVKSFWCI